MRNFWSVKERKQTGIHNDFKTLLTSLLMKVPKLLFNKHIKKGLSEEFGLFAKGNHQIFLDKI